MDITIIFDIQRNKTLKAEIGNCLCIFYVLNIRSKEAFYAYNILNVDICFYKP